MNDSIINLLNASGFAVPSNWKKRFFIIWTGQAFSMFGTSIVSFALIWWLTEKTGSPSVLAASTLFTILPAIILGPFIGTLIDKFNRKNVLIVANISIATLTFFLVVLFYLDIIVTWQIIMVIFFREIGLVFQSTTIIATTTLMVPETQLTRINGINQVLSGLLRIIGAPAGALLVTTLPIYTTLSIDIITCFIAVMTVLFIVIPSLIKKIDVKPDDLNKSSFFRDTIDGLRFVLKWRALFWVVMTCTFANVFLGPSRSFQPLMVTQIYSGGAIELSYISAVAGIGVILGGLLMIVWKGFSRKLITSAIGWIGIGIAYIIASITPSNMFVLFIGMFFIIGFMTPVGCAPLDAFYQSVIPADKQGRVFGVLGSIDGLTMPIGLIIAWMVGHMVPLRAWYILVGFSHAILGLIWLGIPFIRRAEDEARKTVKLLK